MLSVYLQKVPWPVIALAFVPISLMVLLSAPAWLSLPFLSEQRRHTMLQLVDRLIEWTRAIHPQQCPGQSGMRTPDAALTERARRRRAATRP
jgi:hypothetical protein